MKKILIAFALACVFLAPGCQKFLDLKPENIQVVSKVEDYRDLLASYMRLVKAVNGDQYPVLGGYYINPYFDVAAMFAYRSGELSINPSSSAYYDAARGEFKQSAVNIMTWMDTEESGYCWDQYFSFLGPINLIIGGIDDLEGDDRMRDYVKGEALVWRAYSYFKLLQYFSPYQGNAYGIPIYLKPYEDPGNAMPERKTQTEVYQQILADCQEVFHLLERTPTTTWNYAYQELFLHQMLASVYCYKAMGAAAEDTDWENALLHANEAMKGRSFVRDQATFKQMFNCYNPQIFEHDEFNLRMVDGSNRQICNFLYTYYQPSLTMQAVATVDPAFFAKYKADDVRRAAYFVDQYNGTYKYDKYNISVNFYARYGFPVGGVIMPYRAAENQLIKAEALCRLGRAGEAREALNFFKAGRYLDVEGSYTESDLLAEILKERKLEFYHEGDICWLDMKRTGERVERIVNGVVHVLQPDDFRYCFPIPKTEMKVNKNMVQNPGWNEITL